MGVNKYSPQNPHFGRAHYYYDSDDKPVDKLSGKKGFITLIKGVFDAIRQFFSKLRGSSPLPQLKNECKLLGDVSNKAVQKSAEKAASVFSFCVQNDKVHWSIRNSISSFSSNVKAFIETKNFKWLNTVSSKCAQLLYLISTELIKPHIDTQEKKELERLKKEAEQFLTFVSLVDHIAVRPGSSEISDEDFTTLLQFSKNPKKEVKLEGQQSITYSKDEKTFHIADSTHSSEVILSIGEKGKVNSSTLLKTSTLEKVIRISEKCFKTPPYTSNAAEYTQEFRRGKFVISHKGTVIAKVLPVEIQGKISYIFYDTAKKRTLGEGSYNKVKEAFLIDAAFNKQPIAYSKNKKDLGLDSSKNLTAADFNRMKSPYLEPPPLHTGMKYKTKRPIMGVTAQERVHTYKEFYDTDASLIKNLTQKQRYQIVIALLNGVKDMHRLGYGHGDIKPQNILIKKGTGDLFEKVVLADLEGAFKLDPKGNTRSGQKITSTQGFFLGHEVAGIHRDLYGVGKTIEKIFPEGSRTDSLKALIIKLVDHQASSRPSAEEALKQLSKIMKEENINLS